MSTRRFFLLLFSAFLWQAAAHADLDDIRRTAEAGDGDAQLQLGILFEYGFNMKGNEIPALTWYTLAANQGNAKAAKLRDTLKSKMSEKEVEEAMGQVTSFKPKGVAPMKPTVPEAVAPAASPTPAPEPQAPDSVSNEPLPVLDATPSATPEPSPAPGK